MEEENAPVVEGTAGAFCQIIVCRGGWLCNIIIILCRSVLFSNICLFQNCF